MNRGYSVDSAHVQSNETVADGQARGGAVGGEDVAPAACVREIVVAQVNPVTEFGKRSVEIAEGVAPAQFKAAVVRGTRPNLNVGGEPDSSEGTDGELVISR